jgi:Zn-dependent peptidase ImmA (M78 family)|tara:strand:- start:202 stop:393 length:192 start_codon:yes stop_codon:yes gene_type:complete
MKFLSQSQKETISKSYGISVESINKRIELWSLINDPDISKPDLIAAQREWIRIQQGTWPNVHE